MANLAKENFSKGIEKIQKHFKEKSVSKSGVGLESATDVRDTVEATLEKFGKQVVETRLGQLRDKKSQSKIPPVDISLDDAARVFYGCDSKELIKSIGIYTQSDTVETACNRLGFDGAIDVEMMYDMMVKQGQSYNISSPASTPDIDSNFRFIIPELIINAIRTGYMHTSQHQNWIATTQNMTNRELTMPQIKRGDAMPTVINEGQDAPIGSVEYGQKKVNVFKVGTGFNLTDELIQESTLDHMFIFLSEVGNDMSIATDTNALSTLINGEQADLSESAPVIGVENVGNGLDTFDLRRVMTRMNRLSQSATRAVLTEDISLKDLNFSRPEREEIHVEEYMGIPHDNNAIPSGFSMFLNAARAMSKLQFGSMTTARQRNERNQTNELFVFNHVGFAIIKRDARVLVNEALDYNAAGDANKFPAYMDIDKRIAESFKNF